MENLLIEFVSTLELSFKKLQNEVGNNSGFSKLTINQFQYINAIYELEEPTITELANKMNITKASVTTAINKLINMGFATKTQSNEDKRVFHVGLTEIGKKLIKAKYQALKEYGDFILTKLSKEEARQFKEILTKIIKIFQDN